MLGAGESLGAYITPEGSAVFAPPVADSDLETLDMELGARLEALGLPMGLDVELIKTVHVP